MILVDTSVWVEHLRSGSAVLSTALEEGQVLTHSMIRGELALGTIAPRHALLASLAALPHAARATDEEVLVLIDGMELHGRGLGLVDAHLLAACLLTPGIRVWTKDQRLHAAAAEFGVVWEAA